MRFVTRLLLACTVCLLSSGVGEAGFNSQLLPVMRDFGAFVSPYNANDSIRVVTGASTQFYSGTTLQFYFDSVTTRSRIAAAVHDSLDIDSSHLVNDRVGYEDLSPFLKANILLADDDTTKYARVLVDNPASRGFDSIQWDGTKTFVVSRNLRTVDSLFFGKSGGVYLDSTLVDSLVQQKGVYAAGAGDIVEVVAGSGLVGGAASGIATLDALVGFGLRVDSDSIEVDSSATALMFLALHATADSALGAGRLNGLAGSSYALASNTITPGAGLSGSTPLTLGSNPTLTVTTGWGLHIPSDNVLARVRGTGTGLADSLAEINSGGSSQTINATWVLGSAVSKSGGWNVGNGGTGRQTLTISALLAGGTSTTNPVQSIANSSTSNAVLTPALTSPSTSLPIWNSVITPDSIQSIRFTVRNAGGTAIYRLPRSGPASGQVLKYPGTGDTLVWASDATGSGGSPNVADTGTGAIAGELITIASSGDKTLANRIMTFAAGSNTLTFNMNRDWPGADDADSLGGVPASLYALEAVTLTAGAGLTGGGDLSTNRTFAVGDGSGIVVGADAIDALPGWGLRFDNDSIEVNFTHVKDSAALQIEDSLDGYLTGGAISALVEDSLDGYYTAVYIDANLGDIQSVGDVTSGAAFDGTQGTTLIFNDAQGDGTFTFADLSGTKTWRLPNTNTGNDTLTLLGNTVTGSGAIVRATSPTITTPVLSGGASLSSGDLEVGANSLDGTTTLALDPDNDGTNEVLVGNAIMTFEGGASDPTLAWSSGAFEMTGTLNVTSTLSQGGTAVVLQSRTLTAGSGLTGGGTLASDRSFDVSTGWGTHIIGDAILARSGQLLDSFAPLWTAATIAGNWVNTANPWTVAEGGVGAITGTQYALLYVNGTDSLRQTAPGTSAQFLAGNTGGAPAFRAIVDSDIPNNLTINNTASGVRNILVDTVRLGDRIVFSPSLQTNVIYLDSIIVDSIINQKGVYAAGTGDITAVGNVTSGGAFNGTAGTELYFEDAQGDGTLTFANLAATKSWILPNTNTGNDTLTLLGNTVQGSGAIVRATSPSIATPTVTTSLTMTGFAALSPSGTFPTAYRFTEPSGSGTDYIGFRAPNTNISTQTYILPVAAGTVGQILKLHASVADSLTWAVDDDLPDADEVTESMLKAVNSPTDEYVLTYESTTGDFEWVVNTAFGDNLGNHTATADLEIGAQSIDGLNSSSGLSFDFDNSGTNDFNMNSVLGSPSVVFVETGEDPGIAGGWGKQDGNVSTGTDALTFMSDSSVFSALASGRPGILFLAGPADTSWDTYAGFQAPWSQSQDRLLWVLPGDSGSTGHVLKRSGLTSDKAGILTWAYADTVAGGATRATTAKRADTSYTIAYLDSDTIITDLPMEPTGGAIHIGYDWDGGGSVPHDSVTLDSLIMRIATPSANGTPLEVRDTSANASSQVRVMHYRINVPIPIGADSLRNVIFTAATDNAATHVVGKVFFGHPDSSTGVGFKVAIAADSITGSIANKVLTVNRDVNSLAGVYGSGGQITLLFSFRMRSTTVPESARLYGARVVWSHKRAYP